MTGSITVPAGLSWRRLTCWLLDLDDDLPAPAVPQVADLYVSWALGRSGKGSLAPKIARQVYRWLVNIERTHLSPTPFDNSSERNRRSLASKLRITFLFLCNHTPDLAKAYVRSLRGRHRHRDIDYHIIDFPGLPGEGGT